MKLQQPFIQILIQHGTFQKYDFTVEKTINNVLKTTEYKLLSVVGIENKSELFKCISEIIETELKY